MVTMEEGKKQYKYDADSDLTYAHARYLSTANKTFLSEDPYFYNGFATDSFLLNPQLQNSYGYAANNPINFTDPTGQLTWNELKSYAGGTGKALLNTGIGILKGGVNLVVNTYNTGQRYFGPNGTYHALEDGFGLAYTGYTEQQKFISSPKRYAKEKIDYVVEATGNLADLPLEQRQQAIGEGMLDAYLLFSPFGKGAAPANVGKPGQIDFLTNTTIKNNGIVIETGTAPTGKYLEALDNGAYEISRNSPFQGRENWAKTLRGKNFTEYVIPTPGIDGPGPQRLLVDPNSAEIWYTSDHYTNGIKIRW